nr:reverse transcriptase domain-containing protein [Tanacetum cinerariifolium]
MRDTGKQRQKGASQQMKKTCSYPGHTRIMPKEIFAEESGMFKPPPPMWENYMAARTVKALGSYRGYKAYTKAWMNFMIVRSPSPYNGIIKRPRIREIQAVPSTAHGMLKLSVNGRIVTIRSTILTPTECTTIVTTPKETVKKAEARHINFKVAIHPDFSDQEITFGGTVLTKARTELCTLLKRNLDIFAWQPSDMTCVPRSIAEHRLNIQEGYSPVRIVIPFQKSIGKSNPFAATPLSVSWTPIKAIIKYRWPNKMRKRRLSTLVTGYIATQKCPSASRTLAQRLVDKAFDRQIGQNSKIYVDDLVIKSHTETELLRDIEETFRTLRQINMKLNPKKCTFEATEAMFLGYMINPEGIKLCPDKTKAVLQLPSPRTIKEVQSLNGKLAILNRFISK